MPLVGLLPIEFVQRAAGTLMHSWWQIQSAVVIASYAPSNVFCQSRQRLVSAYFEVRVVLSDFYCVVVFFVKLIVQEVRKE